MRKFWPIYKRELLSMFVTPLAWALIAGFLLLQGLHFYFLVANFATMGDVVVGGGPIQTFFGQTIILYVALIFICPLLTMRLFAEERRSGTIEALLTAPVSPLGVVLAKYAAVVTTYMAMWLPTVSYIFVLQRFGDVDLRIAFAGYTAVFLVGAGYLAIGTLASTLTQNQLVAAALAGAVIIALFIFSLGEFIFDAGPLREFCSHVSVWSLLGEFSRGLVDSRRLVFWMTLVVLPLLFATRTVEAWRWG
jgi:ABC-2 type transport system permease protein